jgi:hypothetical protein
MTGSDAFNIHMGLGLIKLSKPKAQLFQEAVRRREMDTPASEIEEFRAGKVGLASKVNNKADDDGQRTAARRNLV